MGVDCVNCNPEMVKRHEEMLQKHDKEISELKEMNTMHEARIDKLEMLIEQNTRLIENSQKIEASLVNGMVSMAGSQNKMIWKIVGVIGSLVAIIGGLIVYLHM